MLIALQKQKENIAEYLLYMFQIEEIIRTFQLDLDKIMTQFVEPSIPNVSYLNQYREWYADLIKQMKVRGLEKEGHTETVNEVIMELVYLHNTLLTIVNDEKYKTLVEHAAEYLKEFKGKANMNQRNDVEVLLHAMYMKLQLKMRKQEISAETEEAMDKLRIQLAYLAREYGRMKSGNWSFGQN
ncbi:MAG: DUF4924 family protein [Flavobacteriales bacterium]|nr:DUF4924 family protein [Flavobacteriales bacterium]